MVYSYSWDNCPRDIAISIASYLADDLISLRCVNKYWKGIVNKVFTDRVKKYFNDEELRPYLNVDHLDGKDESAQFRNAQKIYLHVRELLFTDLMLLSTKYNNQKTHTTLIANIKKQFLPLSLYNHENIRRLINYSKTLSKLRFMQLFCKQADQNINNTDKLNDLISDIKKTFDDKVNNTLVFSSFVLDPVDFSQVYQRKDEEKKFSALTYLFPELLDKTQSFSILYLDNQRLHDFPKEMVTVKNIWSIYARNNLLYQFPHSLLDMSTLERLYLSDNPIKKIPLDISKLNKLTFFECENCELEELPTSLNKLTNLFLLNVKNNKLTHLPKELAELMQLEVLNVSENPIIDVPHELQSLANQNRRSPRDHRMIILKEFRDWLIKWNKTSKKRKAT